MTTATPALTLVDERGCVVEKLISDFTYDQEKGTADATLYSMFRLPHSNRTYFQCDVAICQGECEQPRCDSGNQRSASLGQINEDDPFSRPEENAVTTSTSVFVAQPGSPAAGDYNCTDFCHSPKKSSSAVNSILARSLNNNVPSY